MSCSKSLKVASSSFLSALALISATPLENKLSILSFKPLSTAPILFSIPLASKISR